MLTHVNSLFLLDSLLVLPLGVRWSEALLVSQRIRRVASLLIELTAGAVVLFLNDEVRGSIQISVGCVGRSEGSSWVIWVDPLVLKRVGVLTDVGKKLATLVVLLGPLCNVVGWFLRLQSLENDLIFASDLHELTLASFSVQALLVGK